MQSKAFPEIFAVGVSNFKESFIGIGKLEGQWNSVVKNVGLMFEGKPLQAHKEAMPFMKGPALMSIGHGGYTWVDLGNMHLDNELAI